jgi:hypothetical protein
MMMKWIAAAMLMLAVAVSTFELSCVASERAEQSPAASAGAYSEPATPDLPSGSELDEREPASIPVLTR